MCNVISAGDPTLTADSNGSDVSAGWAAAVRQALMPVTPQTSATSLQIPASGNSSQQQQGVQQLNVPSQGNLLYSKLRTMISN